ncbi:MAG: hypothetical protein HW419_3615 [Deltaproteobacteria bacterium]|nr:hypothetical protein [Deltaproteobacteria bacterium]
METKSIKEKLRAWLPGDPRYYQIAVLSSPLIYGIGWLSFDIGWPQVAIALK